MRVYHTSDVKIDTPDILHSRNALDFGRGFYVTQLLNQALKYANRFFRVGKTPFLHVYEYSPNSEFKVKTFNYYDKEWLEFVCDCRGGSERYKEYDIIEGGVANDRVFQTVDLYMAGIYLEQALQRLVYEKPNHQICFITQDSIDRCLRLIDCRSLQNG